MSEPDELLERLGALEREYDDAFPHAWEDVVRGDRTAAEVLAERQGIDDPQELRALAEELRPIGTEEREAWVDRLAAGLGAPPERRLGAAASTEPTGPALVASADPRPRPRPRARLAWLITAGGSLAAAALALWLLGPRDDAPLPGAAPLPGFALVVRNETVHEIRSTVPTPGAVPRYQPSSSLHWVIRPERSVDPPLGLRVLAQALSPEIPLPRRRLLDPGAVDVSPRGVIELRGTLGDLLPLALGRWSLRMVVAEPDALPADLAAFDGGGAWVVTEPYELDVIP
jgi:hypothetical protein